MSNMSAFHYELSLAESQHDLRSNLLPLGLVKKGAYRHRALLFKVGEGREGGEEGGRREGGEEGGRGGRREGGGEEGGRREGGRGEGRMEGGREIGGRPSLVYLILTYTAGPTHTATLLLQVLCDELAVGCTLVRGEYNRYWNQVVVMAEDNPACPVPRTYLVDLVRHPGKLLLEGSAEANQYTKL